MKVYRMVLIAFTLTVLSSNALACSNCITASLTAAEFDRLSWDNSRNVYVGTVVKAELSFPENSMPVITYTLKTEEVFKGNPDTTGVIHSRRTLRPWHSDLEEWVCGSAEIFVGDRLIIFSNPDQPVYIGMCSASRVVDRLNSSTSREARNTLERMRSWSGTL